MKYLSSIALVAIFVSGRPQYVRSEKVVSFEHKSLPVDNNIVDRHLQEPMSTSATAGPVTLQQLELIQAIIRQLSQAVLPDGVDLTKVNVAIIVTEVLQESGIDASVSDGDLSEADIDLIVQEVIDKAAEILGVDSVPSCVCSPLSYTFTINLSQNCDTDTISGNPGIGDTVCQIINRNADDVDSDTLIVFDVQFLEVDTSGNLTVINQDDTYNNVSLSDGDTISFNSVSANLNPEEPLSSQLNYIPGGVLMSLRARSEGGSTIVTNRVSWIYTNSCESLPISVGDTMGWITLSDQIEASHAFCPVATTSSPSKAPTPAPIADTDSPTRAPVTPTPTKENVPTTAPTASPTTFGKAGKGTKSNAGKGTKSSKSDPLAKTIKEGTDTGTKSSKSDTIAKAIKQEVDASASAKTTKTKQEMISAKSVSNLISKGSKSESHYLFSKGNKSKTDVSKAPKSNQKQSESASTSADAKAQKYSSKATQQAAAQSMMI